MVNWLADGERGLWIQANNLKWFYARFAQICHGLNSTNSLAFHTLASDNIDRTSFLVLPGGARCFLQSLSPSAGSPKKRSEDALPAPQTQ
jgi:hypothetical protein